MARPSEISPRKAAQCLGVTLSHLYHLLWAGKLSARRQDGRWLIPAAAVAARLKARKERNATSGRRCA